MHRNHWMSLVALGLATTLSACDATRPTESPSMAPARSDEARSAALESIALEVRQLAAERGIGALPQAPHVRPQLVQLGRALAFDPVLSGPRTTACMTCHVPAFGTGDGKSLSVGEGGIGLGPERSHPDGVFIPRNAPALYNLGAMRRLFWDGRVEVDAAGDFHTPAGEHLTPAMTEVFEFGAVSALALFPVTSRIEMRGFADNELAAIADDDFTGIWSGLMARLGAIPEYRRMFENAYPGTSFDEMTFAHAANAIGGFIVEKFTFTKSPWDRFLAGQDGALTPPQLEGARTFLTLRCAQCHFGATFSDQEFHDVAVAQIGPGVGNGEGGRDDFGRMNVTGLEGDRYRFRTTPLRNVELTAPYGHDGAIVDLRDFIEHYSDSHLKLMAYDPAQLEPALRGAVLDNTGAILAHRDPLLEGVVLTDEIVNQLMAFMLALTDDAARRTASVVPQNVPSGLLVERP